MKVLLLALNSRFTHSNLALLSIKNYIPTDKYESEILELTINENIWEMLKQIYAYHPQIICFSVYIWNAELVKQLLLEIPKILPEIILIAGGPEVTYNPEYWVQNYCLDYVVCGGGEKAVSILFQNNLSLPDKIIRIPNFPLNELLFAYENTNSLSLKHKYLYYESSRGCPFKCSYCLSSSFSGNIESRAISKVKTELSQLLDWHPNIIKFVDRTFNLDPKHYRPIWEFLLLQDTETMFHFEIFPELLTDEDFSILQTVPLGKFQFEIGIQSTNPETLCAINRNADFTKAKTNILKLKALGNIHLHLDAIAGLPYEDLPSFRKSFNEIVSLEPKHFQLGFLKVLQGTEMYRRRTEFGIEFASTPPYQVLKTKWMSFEDLSFLSALEDSLDSFYNKTNFRNTFSELIKEAASPYDFWADLTANLLQIKEPLSLQGQFQFLHTYITNLPNSEHEYLFDLLDYDWALHARSHFFPDFLQPDRHYQCKKQHYHQVLEKIRNGKMACLTKELLNKTVFVSPCTEKFSTKFFSGNPFALILDGRIISFWGTSNISDKNHDKDEFFDF